MVCPSFADIGKNESNPTCDDTTIGATSGTTSLEAEWTANTINLDWYADDTKVSTGTCAYDGGITLPTQPTPPTGYVFSGWQVRAAQCLPSDFNYDGSISTHGYTMLNGSAGSNESTYGLTVGSGEWAVDYGNAGVIKGMAKCSAKSGNNSKYTWTNASSEWSASESELTSAGDGQYCWCQITGYDANKDKEYCQVASPSWVFYSVGDFFTSPCAYHCAAWCSSNVKYSSDFRAALFGQVM